MNSIVLEQAKPEDFEIFWLIEQSTTGSKFYSSMSREETQEEFDTCKVYFIKQDEKVVGSIWYYIENPQHVHVSGTIVLPSYRGQGIGREAKRQLLEEIKHYERIDTTVHPHNTPIILINLSLGFVIESWKDNFYGDGEPRLILVFKKDSLTR